MKEGDILYNPGCKFTVEEMQHTLVTVYIETQIYRDSQHLNFNM